MAKNRFCSNFEVMDSRTKTDFINFILLITREPKFVEILPSIPVGGGGGP